MHFFPAMMCDEFVHSYSDCSNVEGAMNGMKTLVAKIDERIKQRNNKSYHRWRSGSRKAIVELQDYARLLYNGISDLHSDEGIKEVAERYTKNQEILAAEILPRIIRAA